MLEVITFLEDWRCFKINDAFAFESGVNLLVGDQGTGKSSLLSAIQHAGVKLSIGDPDWHNKKIAKILMDKKQCNSFKFDFEKDNFRTKSYFDSGTTAFHVGSMWKSHGEQNRAILDNMAKAKDSIISMDKPDMALSIRSIIALVKLLKKLTENGNQIIAAVHNPLIIASFPMVLSLEHRTWMPSAEFIASQYEESNE